MPKTPLSFYLHMIAVAVIVFAVGNYVSSRTPNRAEGSPSIISGDSSAAPRNDNRESVYDRVMSTGTIRCGYVVWPPLLTKDTNTGQFSGASYEYMEAIGKELGLKIEWTEEVGWGNFYAGLDTNRYDAMCVPVWQSGQRAKIALLSRPIHYEPMMAAVRADDARFDTSLQAINNADVNITVIDNDITKDVATTSFPNAKITALSSMIDTGQYLLNITTKKADVVLIGPETVKGFNANNPQTQIKFAANAKPVRLFGNVLAFKRGEYELKLLFDNTIEALNTAGTATSIIDKYKPSLLPISPGYLENTTN